jgi:multidrug efflux pump subunit AcrA (membrane-fusion protein)
MYAETELELLRKDASLTLPIQAVSRNGKQATVLVVGPGNRIEERVVQIGMEGAHRLEIVAGLAEGDRVVVGSRSQFRPGEVVEPRPIEEPKDDAEASL